MEGVNTQAKVKERCLWGENPCISQTVRARHAAAKRHRLHELPADCSGQRCVRQRQAGARLVGEGGAWAAPDVAPDQRTRLVTMRLREGRGSTHLASFLLAEEEEEMWRNERR